MFSDFLCLYVQQDQSHPVFNGGDVYMEHLRHPKVNMFQVG